MDDVDAVVIGGGLYGCVLAIELRRMGAGAVILLEREADLLPRASRVNQARVHGGYHYPESFLTALRSRVNAPRFREEYRDCIDDGFAALYAVARRGSSVSGRQFRLFCERIGAPVRPARDTGSGLFSRDLVDSVFEVEEAVFDARRLRERLRGDLGRHGVRLVLGAEARRLVAEDGGLRVAWREARGEEAVRAVRVYNCTYACLNRLLVDSGVAPLPLKLQITEMALVEVPRELERVGITVVSGPFFSLLPLPGSGGHLLSHVRYTPHSEWNEGTGAAFEDPDRIRERFPKRSRYPSMVQDAARYVPALRGCRYLGSHWETKAFLPRSESDQSRPILVHRSREMPGLVNVLGAKIDNVYDMIEALDLKTVEPTRS